MKLILTLLFFFFSQPLFADEIKTQSAGEYVRQLLNLGTKIPGSLGHTKTIEFIKKDLEAKGYLVELQNFTAQTPFGPKPMTNIIAKPAIDNGLPVTLLAAHYDTKQLKDEIMPGANDGASGTALLLSIAGDKIKAAKGCWLVFFDGEEAFVKYSDTDGLYGSRYFAEHLDAETKKKIKAAIVVDMIGDTDLDLMRVTNSSPELLDLFDKTLSLTGYDSLISTSGGVKDDHLPLISAGIPSLLIIDFNYAYWHTSKDTLDHISSQSIEIVIDIVNSLLNQL